MGWLRDIVLGGALAVGLGGAAMATELSDVTEALKLPELTELMRAEGHAYAAEIESGLLPGGGGALWDRQVAGIYDTDRMMSVVTDALEQGLDAPARAAVVAFFTAPAGRAIISYENAARKAMADADIEALSRAAYDDIKGSEDSRLAAVSRFVEVNDLMERNVAGALSAHYQFYLGLSEGGGVKMSEDEIIADVWSEEEELRRDTEAWLFGYLLMAYRPLSDAELEEYIAFSATDAGSALNAALFAGFDRMYREISYGLGRAAAQAMQGSDL